MMHDEGSTCSHGLSCKLSLLRRYADGALVMIPKPAYDETGLPPVVFRLRVRHGGHA